MRKKLVISASLLSMAMLAFLLGGCGSSKKEGAADPASTATKIDNFNCTSTCHAATTSKVASAIPGASIPTDWLSSTHNLRNAADCQDCHGGGSNHWGLGPIPVANPDEAKTCLNCHAAMPAPHFNNITSPNETESTGLKRLGYPASFVTSRGEGKCRNCHNPHNPTTIMPINTEWATSGHGDVNALPWRKYDFKTRGTSGANPRNSTATDCVRCHTTTGYINYVTSNFANIAPWGVASDKTKEVLQCNVCHTSTYDFSQQRSLGQITAYYNYSSKNTKKVLQNITYPDLGKGNMCMVCHAARETGVTLKAVSQLPQPPTTAAAFVNYSGQSFINSHYFAAGATIYNISGWEYAGLSYTDPAFYIHKFLGVGTQVIRDTFDSTVVVNATIDAQARGTRGQVGPCVTCHMQVLTSLRDKDGNVVATKASHKFRPELDLTAGNAATTTAHCAGCHAVPPVAIPAGYTVVTTEALLQQQKDGYDAALAALTSALKKRKFTFVSNSPYFTNSNWQTRKGTSPNDTGGYGAGTGANTMGAAFNLNLLIHDPGGFAHNSTYSKRLIHDSIVWIATGSVTLPATVGATTYNTIADVINDAVLVPTDAALIANKDGIAVNFDAAMKAKAIAWLTNNQGTFARP